MSKSQERAREQLPSVLLTLLSIVQALALETFWSHFRESEVLWQGGWPALLGWIQVAAILLGIAEIWLFYVSLILRFTWVPRVRDMVLPFGIGLLEFSLVELQGVERIGSWMFCLTAIFAVVLTESHLIFRQARRDPNNEWFFEGLDRARFSDYARQMISVSVLGILAIVVAATGSQRWIALIGLLVGLGMLGWQVYVTAYYWRRTITSPAR